MCTEAFVTNAVKHFKHEMRGKRRLHERPNAYEIERCKVWLELEREIVKPAVIVALGARAARGLLGRPVTITKLRGRMLALSDGTAALVTIHPSFLLRIQDAAHKKREYGRGAWRYRTPRPALSHGWASYGGRRPLAARAVLTSAQRGESLREGGSI
jgi:hypothetical protein